MNELGGDLAQQWYVAAAIVVVLGIYVKWNAASTKEDRQMERDQFDKQYSDQRILFKESLDKIHEDNRRIEERMAGEMASGFEAIRGELHTLRQFLEAWITKGDK